MKIIVDENIPLMTVQTLCGMGHGVLDIRGTPDEGMHDDPLWEMAQREERLLITTDKGFTQYRYARHHGVLIVPSSTAKSIQDPPTYHACDGAVC